MKAEEEGADTDFETERFPLSTKKLHYKHLKQVIGENKRARSKTNAYTFPSPQIVSRRQAQNVLNSSERRMKSSGQQHTGTGKSMRESSELIFPSDSIYRGTLKFRVTASKENQVEESSRRTRLRVEVEAVEW